MFGMDVPTQPQIDTIVLDFPIFPTVGNGRAQSVDYGLKVAKNWGFSPLKFLGGTYTGDKIFQNTPRREAVSRKSAQGCRKICGGKKENQNVGN